MTTTQYIVQDKATLIRRIVDQLVSLKLIQDLNAEVEIRSNSNVLYKGRPKGIALDRLDDQSFSLLAKAFSKSVQLDLSSEVQASSIFVYADKKPMLTVDGRTGKVNSLNVPLKETQRLSANTQISPVQQEVFNRIIQSVERTKASPVRNFITQLLKDIATAPQRGQQRRADERMAKTATALLENFGRVENGKLVYQTTDYLIEKQADRTTVRDSRGSKILQFTDSLVGPRIIASKVTDDTRYEFKAAKKEIANGIALDPLERSRQLGSLAPASEIGIAQEIGRLQTKQTAIYNAEWVVEAAVKLLDRYGNATGKNMLSYEDSSLYSIQKDLSKNDLSIADKSGRVLLEMKGGQLTNVQLEPQDIRNFGILQDYLMNNPVDKGGQIFQETEPSSTESQPSSSPMAEGQAKVGASQAVPYRFQTSTQFTDQEPSIVDERGFVRSQFVSPTEKIYSAAAKLLENYGSDLGSTAKTYTAFIEVVAPQPQVSTGLPSQSQLQEGQNSPPTRRVISAYNEVLSTYESSADRRDATDQMYSGVMKVDVDNGRDVSYNAALPELSLSQSTPTFYAIQDGKDYLVLPIPGQQPIKSSAFRGMYDVAGNGSSIESIQEPARFRSDENGNLSLVQKGSVLSDERVKETELPSKSTESLGVSSVSTSDSATTKAGIRSVEILRDYDKNTFSMSVTEPGETSRNVLLIDTKSGFVVNNDIRSQDFQYLEELTTQQQSLQSQERGNQVEL